MRRVRAQPARSTPARNFGPDMAGHSITNYEAQARVRPPTSRFRLVMRYACNSSRLNTASAPHKGQVHSIFVAEACRLYSWLFRWTRPWWGQSTAHGVRLTAAPPSGLWLVTRGGLFRHSGQGQWLSSNGRVSITHLPLLVNVDLWPSMRLGTVIRDRPPALQPEPLNARAPHASHTRCQPAPSARLTFARGAMKGLHE